MHLQNCFRLVYPGKQYVAVEFHFRETYQCGNYYYRARPRTLQVSV